MTRLADGDDDVIRVLAESVCSKESDYKLVGESLYCLGLLGPEAKAALPLLRKFATDPAKGEQIRKTVALIETDHSKSKFATTAKTYKVRVAHLESVPTRRLSYSVGLFVINESRGPGEPQETIVARISYGADKMNGRDSIRRLLEFLEARPSGPASRSFACPAANYSLEVVPADQSSDVVWKLTDENGETVTVHPFRKY